MAHGASDGERCIFGAPAPLARVLLGNVDAKRWEDASFMFFVNILRMVPGEGAAFLEALCVSVWGRK